MGGTSDLPVHGNYDVTDPSPLPSALALVRPPGRTHLGRTPHQLAGLGERAWEGEEKKRISAGIEGRECVLNPKQGLHGVDMRSRPPTHSLVSCLSVYSRPPNQNRGLRIMKRPPLHVFPSFAAQVLSHPSFSSVGPLGARAWPARINRPFPRYLPACQHGCGLSPLILDCGIWKPPPSPEERSPIPLQQGPFCLHCLP